MPNALPFILTAVVSVTATVTIGLLQIRTTKRVADKTIAGAVDQITLKDRHDRQAEHRAVQREAWTAFLTKVHELISACVRYAQFSTKGNPNTTIRSSDPSTFPKPLHDAVDAVHAAVEGIELAGPAVMAGKARAVHDQSLLLAFHAICLSHARAGWRHDLDDEMIQPRNGEEEERHEYRAEREKAFDEQQRGVMKARAAFLKTARTQLWGEE
jgi:hypothetical protein